MYLHASDVTRTVNLRTSSVPGSVFELTSVLAFQAGIVIGSVPVFPNHAALSSVPSDQNYATNKLALVHVQLREFLITTNAQLLVGY